MVTAWTWRRGVYGNISFSHLLEVVVLKLWAKSLLVMDLIKLQNP